MSIRISGKPKTITNGRQKLKLNVMRLFRQEKTLSEIGKTLNIHPSLAAKLIRASYGLEPNAKIINRD